MAKNQDLDCPNNIQVKKCIQNDLNKQLKDNNVNALDNLIQFLPRNLKGQDNGR